MCEGSFEVSNTHIIPSYSLSLPCVCGLKFELRVTAPVPCLAAMLLAMMVIDSPSETFSPNKLLLL